MGVSGIGVGVGIDDDGNILPFPIREQCNDGTDENAEDEMEDTGTKPETLPTREHNNALLANFMLRFTGHRNGCSGKQVPRSSSSAVSSSSLPGALWVPHGGDELATVVSSRH